MKNKLKIFVWIVVLVLGMLGANYLYGQYHKPDEKKKLQTANWTGEEAKRLSNSSYGDYETTLPTVYIDTNNQDILKEAKINIKLGFTDNNGEPYSALSEPSEVYYAKINHRGASSYIQSEKKQYRVEFYTNDKYKKEQNVDFLGMSRHSEWVLNGPYLDKTLMRNKLVYDLGRVIFEWAPDSRFCELYLDGEYQGVYLALEPITVGEGRLRLSKFGLLSGATSFIVKRDRIGTDDVVLNTYGTVYGKTNNELQLVYPSQKSVTDKELDWITDRISGFERELYKEDFVQDRGYEQYIDIDSFVDYYLINECTMNLDAGNLSTYVYAELGGKMQLAIWDFNNSFDNYVYNQHGYDEYMVGANAWFDRLVQDPYFMELVRNRYWELRDSLLEEEYLSGRIDEYRDYLGDAIDRNFAVWGYTFYQNLLVDGPASERDISSYDDAIAQLKTAIHERLMHLDERYSVDSGD